MTAAAPLSFAQRRSWAAALATVAVTYFYFLLYAEFSLLELVRAAAPGRIQPVMTALGGGGILGALLAAAIFKPHRARTLLAGSFHACAAAAFLAVLRSSYPTLFAAAALTGLALGALTVVLSATLLAATGGRHLGLALGLGTGGAYAACNLPPIFHATPLAQTVAAASLALAASFLPRLMLIAPASEATRWTVSIFSRREIARWTVVLLALVWMDSAAFYIIQHTPALRGITWQNTPSLLANAAVHLAAAVLAGAALDRGFRRPLAIAAALALLLACLALESLLPLPSPAAWLYTAGVSFYSVVLIEFPSRAAAPRVAALVYAVAGWLGSALGIGMAQDLARIPPAFIASATLVLAVALALRFSVASRSPLAVSALCLAFALPSTTRAETPSTTDAVSLGREVYISEGCIHCHSQFVRPRAPLDVAQWGPAPALATAVAATPPLFGTRRQGPDLTNVGARRSAEWHRLHLIAPREVSPGSRMPSYAHLFSGGDNRGENLVAYLISLGANTAPSRQAQVAAWIPDAAHALPLADTQRRFQQLCRPCHGPNGRGDGPLAGRLSYRPPDWSITPFRHLAPDTPLNTHATDLALARIIKFGLPGLAMAGHEYLPDADVVGLARFVQSLHAGPAPRSPPAAASSP